jgi:HEAT repeat protein
MRISHRCVALFGLLLLTSCASEETLRRERPAEYWQKTLKKSYPHEESTAVGRDLSADDFKALIGLLEGPDEFFQESAADAIAHDDRLAEKSRLVGPALPALEKLLSSRNENVRDAAIDTLGRIGNDAYLPLMRALKNQDCWVRARAAQAISEMGPKAQEAAPAIMAIVRDWGCERIPRALAMEALTGIHPPPPDTVSVLEDVLREEKDLRPAAAEALLNLGDSDKAMAYLRETIRARDPAERLAAARVLARSCLTSGEGLNLLLAAIKNPSPRVRATVIANLSCKPPLPPEVVEALALRLEDGHQELRVLAARRLGSFGAGAHAAEEALERALGDPDDTVRKEAGQALKKIRGKG